MNGFELSSFDKVVERVENVLPVGFGQLLNIFQSLERLFVQHLQIPIAHREKLNAYFNDGSIEIDNNLVENAIRPLALGRKNYLFAGSHEAAERAACIYSFFAMCRKEDVNPLEWMIYVFDNLKDTRMTELDHLFPSAYKRHLSESSTD